MKVSLIFLAMAVSTCESLRAKTAEGVAPAIAGIHIPGLTLSPCWKYDRIGFPWSRGPELLGNVAPAQTGMVPAPGFGRLNPDLGLGKGRSRNNLHTF